MPRICTKDLIIKSNVVDLRGFGALIECSLAHRPSGACAETSITANPEILSDEGGLAALKESAEIQAISQIVATHEYRTWWAKRKVALGISEKKTLAAETHFVELSYTANEKVHFELLPYRQLLMSVGMRDQIAQAPNFMAARIASVRHLESRKLITTYRDGSTVEETFEDATDVRITLMEKSEVSL